MLYCKTMIYNLNPTDVAVHDENNKIVIAQIHTDRNEIKEALCKARGSSVRLRNGFNLPQDIYRHDFFRTCTHVDHKEMRAALSESSKIALTPELLIDPIYNNDSTLAAASALEQRICDEPKAVWSWARMPGTETDATEIDIHAMFETIYDSWVFDRKGPCIPCKSLLEFTVFVNFVIQLAKRTNHLLILGTFAYYDEGGDAVHLCFVEENEVKISQRITRDNERDIFLVSFISQMVRDNIGLQLQNEKLQETNDTLLGKPWAEYVRRIFDDNKDSIANAVDTALVQPLVAAVNSQIIEPNLKRLRPDLAVLNPSS